MKSSWKRSKHWKKSILLGAKKMGNFTFTGIDLHQHPDKSIVLSQSKYVRNIKPISINPQRKDDPTQMITEEERQSLRGLIGSLQYASVHTRPDLSSRLSYLQSKINSATIETLQIANKVLHEAKKHHDVSIKIQPISPRDVRFLAFTDASFASKKCPDSQAGSIILATHQNIEKNISCLVSPIAWGSKKIQKVVTSTLAAETMSLSSNLDQLIGGSSVVLGLVVQSNRRLETSSRNATTAPECSGYSDISFAAVTTRLCGCHWL